MWLHSADATVPSALWQWPLLTCGLFQTTLAGGVPLGLMERADAGNSESVNSTPGEIEHSDE